MGTGILLIVYGALTGIGGVIGFIKAKSKASLIAGGVSGGLLIVSGILLLIGVPFGLYLGFAVTVVLCAVFASRYVKTKAMMPARMMLLISIVVALILGSVIFGG